MASATDQPVIIEAAINGVTTKARNPNTPKTPAEVAREVPAQCHHVALGHRGAATVADKHEWTSLHRRAPEQSRDLPIPPVEGEGRLRHGTVVV